MKSLAEKLNLTPDQHEQLASLPAETIAHLEALHPAIQALIGERWRAGKEVRETNFRGTLDDRFKAMADLEVVQMRIALLDGNNPHHPSEKIDEKTRESFRKRLMEETGWFDELTLDRTEDIDPETGFQFVCRTARCHPRKKV